MATPSSKDSTPNSVEDLIIARAGRLYDEVVVPIERASTREQVDKVLEATPDHGRIGEKYGAARKAQLDS